VEGRCSEGEQERREGAGGTWAEHGAYDRGGCVCLARIKPQPLSAALARIGLEAVKYPPQPPSWFQTEAALPSGDVVSHILNNAKEGEDAERWAGPGRTLSGDSSASPPTDSRQNAKRVRIIFWADGFTVEDLSREEAEEEAPAAPRARKTGIQTLGDHRAAESRMPQMKVPELRKYEDNHQFMEDLKKGLPPSEFREIDLSSGIPVRYGLRLGPCVCPLYTILSLCGTAGYSLPLLADIHPCPSLSCIA